MLKKIFIAAVLFVAGLLIAGCSAKDLGFWDDDYPGKDGRYYEADIAGEGGGAGGGEEPGNGNSTAGIVTAGEWRDLDHWAFWSSLMTGEEFSGMPDLWKMYPDNLVTIHVTKGEDQPLIGAKAVLSRNGTAVWTTKTDNKGFAYLWVSPFQQLQEVTSDELTVYLPGIPRLRSKSTSTRF